MTSTLALLGFLALIFLLVHRGLIACERTNGQVHKRQHGQRGIASGRSDRKRAETPLEKNDTLAPARQV